MLCAVTGKPVAMGRGFRCVRVHRHPAEAAEASANALRADKGGGGDVFLLSAAAYASGLVPAAAAEGTIRLVFEEWV